MNEINQNQEHANKKFYLASKWMTGLFLVMFILLFLYTYYRSEIYHHGTWGLKYFKYYTISCVSNRSKYL